jgi:hypothetical protein
MNHKLYSAHENSHWIYETECFLSSSIRDEEFASHPHAFIQMFQQNSIMSQKWHQIMTMCMVCIPYKLKKDDNDNG